MPLRVSIAALLAAVLGAPALAGQSCNGPQVRGAADFVYLEGNAQVQDRRTGLIWLRCLEGQQWTGATCKADDPKAVNPGPRSTLAEAQRLAARLSRPPDVAWRLPTRGELQALREPGCYNPSFSLEVFPTEPAWSSDGFFWTRTREATGVALVSAIGTSDAWVKPGPGETAHVRLVRDPPEPAKPKAPK